jgi:hypothetical protein
MRIEVPEWGIWNNPEYPNVTAVNVFDQKSGECIAFVFTDDGKVHFAVQLGKAVVTVEHIPQNYPSTDLAFFIDRAHWIDAIKDCDWIMETLRARDCSSFPACPDELPEHGSNGA